MTDEGTTYTAAGEPRQITGRERRQDERQWEALRSMIRAAGHEDHNWRGSGVPPLGDHFVAWLYTCDTCSEVLFVTVQCSRQPCRECFPEGPRERLAAWWKRMRRNR